MASLLFATLFAGSSFSSSPVFGMEGERFSRRPKKLSRCEDDFTQILAGELPLVDPPTPSPLNRSNLQTLSETLRQNRNLLEEDEAWLEALREVLVEEQGVLSEEHREAFLAGHKLRGLFDSGLAHKAIAQAFSDYGYATPQAIRLMFEGFRTLNFEEQSAIIDRVVDYLQYWVLDQVSLGNLEVAQKYARSFGMSFSDYSQFVVEWGRQKSNQYEEVKLALLMKLAEPVPQFVRQVALHQAWWKRFWKKITGREDSVLPVIELQKVTLEELALNQRSALSSEALEAVLSNPSSGWREAFLFQTLPLLSVGQVKQILSTDLIRDELREKLNRRSEVLGEYADLLNDLRVVEDSIMAHQAALKEYRHDLTEKEHGDLGVKIRSNTKGSAQLREIRRALEEYAPRMNGGQFIWFRSFVMDVIREFKDPNESAEGLELLRQFTLTFVLDNPKPLLHIQASAAEEEVLKRPWALPVEVSKKTPEEELQAGLAAFESQLPALLERKGEILQKLQDERQ